MGPAFLRRAAACVSLLFVLATPLGAGSPRAAAREQVEFGINVAMRGLWQEAIYRWEKAIEIDPTYAAAYNNLAVAYEHEGLFEKAKGAYERAMELDPKNASIKQNMEYFKEINDRANRQPPR
jgi:Flp pilus assembly protein TadD